MRFAPIPRRVGRCRRGLFGTRPRGRARRRQCEDPGRGGGQEAVGTLDAEQPAEAAAQQRDRERSDERSARCYARRSLRRRVEHRHVDQSAGEIPDADRSDADAGQERRGGGEPDDAEARRRDGHYPGPTGRREIAARRHGDRAVQQCRQTDQGDDQGGVLPAGAEDGGNQLRADRRERREDQGPGNRGAADGAQDDRADRLAACEHVGHRGEADDVERAEGERRELEDPVRERPDAERDRRRRRAR